ncbi:cytidyltransferase [Paenibacillus sp. MY03]|uniref:AAA family ATPase n=1 Tax=Paenibacillus sp. MY03 TaxID=302980 RepID=UPI000B3CD5D0|nr:AAA family ATPase [Paenibacillus sp. MY03]OUS69073.1 cytidyltransferase [Paenibacillus sp. MY03]
MDERRIGLTLGKFAPLHKGHQYMIETALEEMDEVIVIIYDCPETISIPLHVRADWIRRLYPGTDVIEAWDGPKETGYTAEIMKAQEDYVLGLLGGRKVTHFYSSEPYGEHMSVALNAVNRQVDLQRLTVPVSGTAVRNAPYENRHYLNPIVYRDLVTKVVFLGAPSTGKTTLAESMARHYRTAWMPEYGREYWEQNQIDRRLTLEQLEEIATGHLEREEKQLQEARDVLFVDTNAITTYMFSLYYHGETTQGLARLAREAETRYGLVFLCDADIPYDDTWDRSGEVQREEFQLAIVNDLRERGVPFQILRGTLREREEQVAEALKRLDPL